ncbi:MAG: LCP family protein [Treponema sp.]|nr:LCP family protein [Spirochaetia bacterium]MDY2840660.1 LCP family protein [Treponema sp.]MDY5124505.1 LCP family protein [Treponema sp.]
MKKIRDEQKGIIFIALIIVIIVVLSVVFSVSLKTNIVEEKMKTEDVVRTLFVIEDTDTSVLFTSVMIYNTSSQKAALVNIPGYIGAIYKSLNRVDKIERVYEEIGIESYKTEIEKLLAIKIPYYAVIKMNDFQMLTDYLGGLKVFIPEPIDYKNNSGERFLLPSGIVNLDGDKVAAYLNYMLESEREADVQDRYQNIMSAFITSLHEKKFNIFSKNNFKLYSDAIQTNVNEEEEYTLFSTLSDVDSESIIRQTITGSARNVDGQFLLLPLNNGEFIKEAIKQTTNMLVSADGSLTSRVYVLEIQNGTNKQGLARNTSILFQNASYDVLSAVNADSDNYEKTVIIDHIGNEDVAKMVGEFIHCTNIQNANSLTEEEDYSTETRVDFTIILGKDFNGRYVVPTKSSK